MTDSEPAGADASAGRAEPAADSSSGQRGAGDDARSGGSASRRRLLAAGAGAAGAALAGCSWLQGDGGPGGGDGSGTPTGAGNAREPLAGETLTVGVLAPIPDANPLGAAMANGAKLAVRQLAREGVLGADVEVVVGNTEATPGAAVSEYQRLVRKEGADVTTGVFLDQVLNSLLPRITGAGTLHLTTGAVGLEPARRIADDYETYKYHFRPGPLNAAQVAAAQTQFLGTHADRLGWERVALVVEETAAFDPFYERVKANAGKHVNLVESGRTPAGLRDWRTVFDNVEAAGADLMLVGQAISGIPAAKIWGQQKRPFEFGGIHVPSQVHRFYEEVGGDCRYIFTMNAVAPTAENTPHTRPFVESYREAFDAVPSYAGPITYDAVRMYADAVRQTGSTDPEALIPYLEKRTYRESVVFPTHEFQGPDAAHPHDPVWSSTAESGVPLWHQWQERNGEGVQAVFAPEQHANAQYVKPPWV